MYLSAADFHADLKLMAYNSILFNSLQHEYSTVAIAIEQTAAQLLADERTTMGVENDSFRLLEAAIIAK